MRAFRLYAIEIHQYVAVQDVNHKWYKYDRHEDIGITGIWNAKVIMTIRDNVVVHIFRDRSGTWTEGDTINDEKISSLLC
jgi:hypothetical protein